MIFRRHAHNSVTKSKGPEQVGSKTQRKVMRANVTMTTADARGAHSTRRDRTETAEGPKESPSAPVLGGNMGVPVRAHSVVFWV